MHSKLIFGICALFCSTFFTGCKNFAVSLNEKEIYTPPAIFTDYSIADSRLDACVEQTISDARITSPEQLTRLNCSNAGITSLDGLEAFYALEELNLADNKLVRVDRLMNMSRLKVLILSNNQLTSAAPLLHLLHLNQLQLDNNDTIACGDLHQLASNFDQTLTLVFPEHCQH